MTLNELLPQIEEPEHEHNWVKLYEYYDWYDGDGEITYECSVGICGKRKEVYLPR